MLVSFKIIFVVIFIGFFEKDVIFCDDNRYVIVDIILIVFVDEGDCDICVCYILV